MGNKLPWFPFYVDRFLASARVRRLSGDQIAAYIWLLCEQWECGDLPFDVVPVLKGMPKGISEAAVAYVLTEFFPPDPDTNRRTNPTLARIQEQQATKQANLAAGAAYARGVKARKSAPNPSDSNTGSSPDSSRRSKNREGEKKEDVGGIPPSVLTAGDVYFTDPKTRSARLGQVRGMLQGMTGFPVTEAAMVRGLSDMRVAGVEFRPVVLRTWVERAEKLIEGEAGALAAQESRQAESSVLGHPDANQRPSGWAEDELE